MHPQCTSASSHGPHTIPYIPRCTSSAVARPPRHHPRYLRDVQGALQLRSLATGALRREFALPGVGSVTGFSGERKYSELFFSFQSFVEPGATYRVDLDQVRWGWGWGCQQQWPSPAAGSYVPDLRECHLVSHGCLLQLLMLPSCFSC